MTSLDHTPPGADVPPPGDPRRGAAPGGGGNGGGGGGTETGGSGDQLRRARRPAPARRLSRLHPKPDRQTGATVPEPRPAAPSGSVPLGVLIGGSLGPVEAGAPGLRQANLRVRAELVRVGPGTCQVVLPEWRAAIAVSVPTERLLTATGLDLEGLAGAALTVLINPEALHDRELGLREWRAGG